MPELPEVETVVRQLSAELPGHRIEDVEVLHRDLLREPLDTFTRAVRGANIQAVTRRGKNIVIPLFPSAVLAVNLGMTGRLLLTSPPMPNTDEEEGEALTHPGVFFSLEPRGSLVYADTRRFGSLRIFTPEGWEKESLRLGPEPWDPRLSARRFHQRLSTSRSPVRSWLLDQTHIAGIGNIYALESLFRVGIHPQTPACSLSRVKSGELLQAIQGVLEEAIRARGTTLRDYRTPQGDPGGFEPYLRVYGREGVPCPKCNAAIERIVFGNRSAFFCPACQPTL